ncbi:hypothetical protein ACQUE4_00255 [Lactococcus lactis]|uniref:hypothetical protein n=1 Tax=Lactococcus lactis TaxID=1358 RepID=UPI000657ABF2|nr:hypothetical protein VN91_0435 [Lactococcus lactis subsp. lactis]
MKKITIIGVIALCGISLSACSQVKDTDETKESTTQSTIQSTIQSTEPKRTLTVDENVTTNILGYFNVEGKTEPNSEYTVDYGTLHMVETSDDYGGIVVSLHLSDDVLGSPVYITVNEGTDKEIKKEAFAIHSYDSYMRIKRAKGE